jgi:hypothetical protein
MVFALLATNAECQVCDPTIPDSLGNQVWQKIQTACELRHPTEAQRLAKLRNSTIELAAAKRNLIQTVEAIVDAQSVPGWLDARVREIPALQQKIKDLVLAVASESDAGGLLSGDPSVRSLKNLVSTKGTTLCVLDRIASQRFPLPPGEQDHLRAVLSQLRAEASALDDLDASFTRLIAAAEGNPKSDQTKSPKK